eukprot:10055906-Karenia_brevis.AAC.1
MVEFAYETISQYSVFSREFAGQQKEMARNYIAMRKRKCEEIEHNNKITHKWSVQNRQLATVTIRAPS